MLLLLLLLVDGTGWHSLRTFDPLPEDGDDFLNTPSGFVFDPEGRLYVVDSVSSRIHIWDKSGDYVKSFGAKGQGPGEMQIPNRADFIAGHLFVFDSANRMHKFDPDGNFVDSVVIVRPRLRAFAFVNENLIMLSAREQKSPTEVYNVVQLVDWEANTVAELGRWQNKSFVSPRRGDNAAVVRAFPPAVDIHRTDDGYLFGFSQNKIMYRTGKDGKTPVEFRPELMTEKPTDDEVAYLKELELPCYGGFTFVLKNFDNIKQVYDHDKAYYTNFIQRDGKLIFARTADGGVYSCEGYPRGNYLITDAKTGKLLARGNFNLGQGALLHYRHNTMLAFIDGEETMEIHEIMLGDK